MANTLLWGFLVLDRGERAPSRLPAWRRPKVWHASPQEVYAAWSRVLALQPAREALLVKLSPDAATLSIEEVLGNPAREVV